MTKSPLPTVLGRSRRVIDRLGDSALTDARLLEAFKTHGDQRAFEILIRRYAPMMKGVCFGVLHDSHDTEDAFQATCVVFARKAGNISEDNRVKSWLYLVAYRTARHIRVRRERRGVTEELQDIFAAPQSADELRAYDLRQILEEEIARLPEKYQTALRLCYLDGLTNEAAARQLGCPLGTILSRLSRAREKLHDRFVRLGLAPEGSAWKRHKTTYVIDEESAGSPLKAAETSTYDVADEPPPAQPPGQDESPLS
jgi:RNA polymerase sigma factor (sigma-70 family)